jgi:hypothetical protein
MAGKGLVMRPPGRTLALGVGDDFNPRRTALLHAFVYQGGNGAQCGFEVQGRSGRSP